MRSLDPSALAARRREVRGWLDHPTRAKVAAAVLFTVAMYMWRSGDGITHPQLVAEDGRVFFSEAREFGLPSVVVPYAGYLHVVQRIVALLCSTVSATLAPQLYVAAAVLVVGCVAAIVATCEHRTAWLLASTMMLVPVGGEIFGSLTNVQWFGQVGLLMIAITRSPRSGAVRLGQVGFALAFACDGPFAIFAAPLAAWRVLQARRDGHAWTIGAIVVSGAIVQLSFALGAGSPYEGLRDPAHLLPTMLDRWIGQSAHRGLTVRPATVRADIAFGAAVAAAGLTSGRLGRRILLYTAIVLAATFSRFLPDSGYFDMTAFGERYFYFPRLALVWCFLLSAVRLRWSSAAGLAGLVMMALSVDPWVRAPLPVLPWRDGAREIDRGGPVEIVINPSRPGDRGPDTWTVRVPLSRP